MKARATKVLVLVMIAIFLVLVGAYRVYRKYRITRSMVNDAKSFVTWMTEEETEEEDENEQ